MKNCGWYLWLDGQKIYNIRQLRDNFDTVMLTGYFLGGSLMKWLSDLGEYSIMKRLSEIDVYGDIGKQLEFAFGVSPDKKPESEQKKSVPVFSRKEQQSVSVLPSSFQGSFPDSFTAELPGSFSAIAGNSFSAEYRSSFAAIVGNAFAAKFISSYNYGSYSSFVNGQALNTAASSFSGSAGSFSGIITANVNTLTGSFMSGSFSLGSYTFGKYSQLTAASSGVSSYSSSRLVNIISLDTNSSYSIYGSFGNIGMFFGGGSYRYSETGVVITEEEYHRTLINLSSCPLNAYGYGINLI